MHVPLVPVAVWGLGKGLFGLEFVRSELVKMNANLKKLNREREKGPRKLSMGIIESFKE